MQADKPETLVANGLRLDKWLWCARFFRSRALATKAVAGGLVHVNAERCKPSRLVRVGDRIDITHDEWTYIIIVHALPQRRGPASEARTCYQETAESLAAREQRRQRAIADPAAPAGRPDKHERRALRELRRR